MKGSVATVDIRDLAITGVTRTEIANRAVLAASVTVLGAGGLFVALGLGRGATGTATVLLVAVCAGVAAYRRQFAVLRASARRRRSEFDMAVAVLLDLVNIQMAGGAGLETALLSAASLGDGWAFDEVRATLSAAQASRRSFWDALVELGDRWGVASLSETANAARLAGSHGSRVRQSLVSKASSLRARNLASMEFEAQQRTEQMGLPMVVLFLSFLLFVGYPAMSQTMGSL